MPFGSPEYRALRRYTKALSIALGCRDLHTRFHSDRVLTLADHLAVRAGLSERELSLLRVAATFHDIGKIGVPDRILLKPGKLDAGEMAEMKKHSELGEYILISTEIDGAQDVAQAIRHHHENVDGTGYPDGISGGEIPLCARIIGIVDSYDAMTVARSYHTARPHAEALEIMREESGHKHDPDLLRLFFRFVEDRDLDQPPGEIGPRGAGSPPNS